MSRCAASSLANSVVSARNAFAHGLSGPGGTGTAFTLGSPEDTLSGILLKAENSAVVTYAQNVFIGASAGAGTSILTSDSRS